MIGASTGVTRRFPHRAQPQLPAARPPRLPPRRRPQWLLRFQRITRRRRRRRRPSCSDREVHGATACQRACQEAAVSPDKGTALQSNIEHGERCVVPSSVSTWISGGPRTRRTSLRAAYVPTPTPRRQHMIAPLPTLLHGKRAPGPFSQTKARAVGPAHVPSGPTRFHPLGVLPLHAAGAAAAEGAGQREVDVLLAVHAHHEAGHIHHLLAHTAGGGSTDVRGGGGGSISPQGKALGCM